MAVANVIRVSIVGSAPGGEVWSVNPVWQIGGVSTAEDITTDEAATMATAVAAIVTPTPLLLAMNPGFRVVSARVEARRWDGTLAAQAEANRVSPGIGTGTAPHPFQTAVVTSLRTAGIGASGRGRLYWPATGMVLDASSNRPAAALVTSTLSGMKTLLTSITAALDVTLTNSPVLSVWSRKNLSTLPVNQIQMGDVLDVQRRRRDQLIETYQSLAMP